MMYIKDWLYFPFFSQILDELLYDVTKSFLCNCQILLLVSHGIYPSVKNYSLRWKVTEKKEKFTHQVKACQQVWASTVRSFEIAFKSSPKSFKSGSIKYTQVKFVLCMHR